MVYFGQETSWGCVLDGRVLCWQGSLHRAVRVTDFAFAGVCREQDVQLGDIESAVTRIKTIGVTINAELVQQVILDLEKSKVGVCGGKGGGCRVSDLDCEFLLCIPKMVVTAGQRRCYVLLAVCRFIYTATCLNHTFLLRKCNKTAENPQSWPC